MTKEHPITLPPDLIDEWISKSDIPGKDMCEGIATLAAQWGADQELEACCEWLAWPGNMHLLPSDLRTARRPKPPSLKEQALVLLEPGEPRLFNSEMQDTIRRALEQLNG